MMDVVLDLDDELIARLERKATINGLSLEEQLRKIITDNSYFDLNSPPTTNSAPLANRGSPDCGAG